MQKLRKNRGNSEERPRHTVQSQRVHSSNRIGQKRVKYHGFYPFKFIMDELE